jgi:hypothetical protein
MTTTTRQTRPTETVLPQPVWRYRHLWPHLAVVGVALVLWGISLSQIDLDDLGTVGLISALPATWWLALALLAGGLAVAVSYRGQRFRPAAAYLAGQLLVLYATPPLLETVPHYTYVYKHIGVTQYIVTHGTVDRSIDIYQRWPGFFSLSAWFDKVAGVSSPLSYAAWAELVQNGLWALLVFVLARTVTGRVRQAEIACGIFVLSNWIGQAYYAPQALAYTLALGMYILIYRYCLVAPGRFGLWLEGLVGRLAIAPVRLRTPSPNPPSTAEEEAARTRRRNLAAAAILAVHAAVVFTHQLSPFLTLLSMALLTLAGYLRPLWLLAGAALITVLYLLTNIGFIQNNYGVFTGLNPFANASQELAGAPLSEGKIWVGRAAIALTLLIWLLGVTGVVRRIRQGQVRQAVTVGLFLIAPFLILLGQNYGGEIRLRVFLFSLPWCAIAISWLFTGGRPEHRRRTTAALAGLSVLVAFLAVVASFGLEDVNHVRSNEVQASQWLYQNGTDGSVLMLAGPGFPGRLGANYEKFVGPNRVDVPDLTLDERFKEHPTFAPAATQADIAAVVQSMQQYSTHGYLIFSSTQYANNRSYQLFPNGGMARLEQGIAGSSRFRLVYSNPDARIYELADQAAAGGAAPAASPLGQQVPDQKSQTGPVQQRPSSEPGDDRGKKADD